MSGDEARADPFFRAYKLVLELLMLVLGLWWLFGPLNRVPAVVLRRGGRPHRGRVAGVILTV